MAFTTFTFQILMLQTKIISFIVIFLNSFLVIGVFGICIARLSDQLSSTWINLSPDPSLIIKLFLIVGIVHGLTTATVCAIRGTETIQSLFLSTAIAGAVTTTIFSVLVVVAIMHDSGMVNWNINNFKSALYNFSGYFKIFSLVLLIPSIIILFVNMLSLKYIAKINFNS